MCSHWKFSHVINSHFSQVKNEQWLRLRVDERTGPLIIQTSIKCKHAVDERTGPLTIQTSRKWKLEKSPAVRCLSVSMIPSVSLSHLAIIFLRSICFCRSKHFFNPRSYFIRCTLSVFLSAGKNEKRDSTATGQVRAVPLYNN